MKFIKRIVNFARNAFSIADKVDSNKWSRFLIALDYTYCRVRYHISPSEYLDFKFYNFQDRYRKNFLLRYHQINKFKKINKFPTLTKYKYSFYKQIPDCFYREIILAPECGEDVFLDFVKKHKKIVVKPDKGSLGRDVRVFTYTDDESARECFANLAEPFACEEFICQHEKMTEISPFSVNTIRFLSIREEDDVEIISATLRTGGRPDSIVDNLKKNGVGAQIDINTGTIYTHGFDYNEKIYVKHPFSGVQFLGFNIPNWEEAVALVKRAHKQLPQRLLGWDIAITQTGADIIEANGRPGTPIIQMVDCIPKGEKVLRAIREAEKEKTKKTAKTPASK